MPKKAYQAQQAAIDSLRRLIQSKGWTIAGEQPLQYDGYQITISDGITTNPVDFFPSGKILIQGKAGALQNALLAWREQYSPLSSPKQAQESPQLALEGMQLPQPEGIARMFTGQPRIGLDEAGKGDYFGPLVVGAVYVDEQTEAKLQSLGVRDSKLLSDSRIVQLAEEIKKLCPYEVVTIGAKRYNELYDEMQNLNVLLARGHAFALEQMLEKVPGQLAIADQFGDESYLRAALMEKGRRIRLEQRHRAEEDIAVAAASILARAEFVRQMDLLSSKLGITLPKGASDPAIISVGREIVAKYGRNTLAKVAKLHFKTTAAILM